MALRDVINVPFFRRFVTYSFNEDTIFILREKIINSYQYYLLFRPTNLIFNFIDFEHLCFKLYGAPKTEKYIKILLSSKNLPLDF